MTWKFEGMSIQSVYSIEKSKASKLNIKVLSMMQELL